MEAGELREQITLQTYDAPADTWVNVATDPVVWATPEAVGDERYQFSVRWRADLFGFRDTQWAMRVLWRDRTLEIEDVMELTTSGLVRITAKGIHILVPDLGSQARQTLHPWPTP
jgi:hypothetical protein